jgi:dTDP-4-amino-4,6-dideoxygalactose transaminase
MIKFYSIKKSDYKISKKILNSIKKVISKNNFILGDEVFTFEKLFKEYCGSKYSISCGNGTDALTISLLSLNLKSGSEVIIPAMTYASTFYSILNAKLKPVLVDINSTDPLINFKEMNKKITSKTRVIMPVHLYGSVVDLKKLRSVIKKRNIYIVDDCAQAHGAFFSNGTRVGSGSYADISSFSLYPGKNLGAYGDAGIITTNNPTFAKKISTIRNVGALKKFNHVTIGFNSRLDTIQAAILCHKINGLDILNKKRSIIANKYFFGIKNDKINFVDYSKKAVFHQFVIRTRFRKKFTNYLIANRIEFGLHYPHSINQMKFFKENFGIKKFKNADALANECVSLPIDPMLTTKEVNYIIKVVNKF